MSDIATAARVSGKPRLQTIAAVINPAAGSVRAGAEAELQALVAEFGYQLSVFTVHADDVEPVVRDAVTSAPDLLAVLAGDGTARLAAELCGPRGPLLAPLPGGTLNVLPHALNGPGPWQAALRAALNDGVERIVSGGRLGEQTFYVAAVLGAPALWSGAREALRTGHLLQAKRRAELALRRAFGHRLHFAADGLPERRAEALALICPLVSRSLDSESALEMAALDLHNAQEVMRLAFRGATGNWRDDPAVSSDRVQRGWARKRGSIPAILDGETQKLPGRVTFEFVPQAFRALAPPTPDVASS